jgi:hypothetical protein
MASTVRAPSPASGRASGFRGDIPNATAMKGATIAPSTEEAAFNVTPRKPRRNGNIHAPRAAARPMQTQPMR